MWWTNRYFGGRPDRFPTYLQRALSRCRLRSSVRYRTQELELAATPPGHLGPWAGPAPGQMRCAMNAKRTAAPPHSPTQNLLLAALPAAEYQQLLPHLEP